MLVSDASNFIELVLKNNTKVNCFVYNGSVQADIFSSSTYSTGDNLKIAFAYKANDFVLYINGIQEGLDTSGVLPSTMSQIIINNYTGGVYHSANEYKKNIIFKTRLSNTQLAELTSLDS